jgi:hypothetical protein
VIDVREVIGRFTISSQQLGDSAEFVRGTRLPEIDIKVRLPDEAAFMGGNYFSAVGRKGEMAAP